MTAHRQVPGQQARRYPADLPGAGAAGNDLGLDGIQAQVLHFLGDWVVDDVLYRLIATAAHDKSQREKRAYPADHTHTFPPNAGDTVAVRSTQLNLAKAPAPPQVDWYGNAVVYVVDISRPEVGALLAAQGGSLPARTGARRAGRWEHRAVGSALARFAAEFHPAGRGTDLWYESSGRPRLRGADGGEPAFVSISHSRERVAAVVAEEPVGLDIEYADAARLARSGRGLAGALAESVGGAVEVSCDNFYQVWTAHEAAIKLGCPLGALLSGREPASAIGTARLDGGYVLTLALRGRPGSEQTG